MSERNASIDRVTIRDFWRAGTFSKRELWLTLILIPLNALCLYTIDPFLVGRILGSLARPSGTLTPYIVTFVIVSTIGFIANRIGFVNYLSWQPKVMARLQTECLAMLLKRGTAFHNNRVSGKLVADTLDYPAAYSQLTTVFITNILPFVVTTVAGLLVITYNSPILGLVVFVMVVLAVGSGIAQRRKMSPLRMKRIKSTRAVTSHLADTVVNIQAVKTFAREPFEMSQHQKLNDRLLHSRIHDWTMVARDGSDRIAVLMVVEFVFILTTIWLVRRNPLLLAAGIFAFSYSVTLINRLFDIGTMLRVVEEALLLAEPMTTALQESHEVMDRPEATHLRATHGAIAFKDVHFHYSDSSEAEVFSGLNLDIKPGEKIGLVGPSGGGKSTVTKLLLRFEDIQSGSICIDDQDIATVTQASLRVAITYVPQESLLFHRTIRENIMYGNTKATEAEVERVAKDAYAHEFIMGLPKGYETVVGERGVKLSGGQRQRIAIARAMLKEAPILVLDEATSALDSESEKVIQEALWELMRTRTAVVIAHRLSTIQRLDRIIVLDQGKIVEDGTHQSLLDKKGLYAKLWARQSGGFIEGPEHLYIKIPDVRVSSR